MRPRSRDIGVPDIPPVDQDRPGETGLARISKALREQSQADLPRHGILRHSPISLAVPSCDLLVTCELTRTKELESGANRGRAVTEPSGIHGAVDDLDVLRREVELDAYTAKDTSASADNALIC